MSLLTESELEAKKLAKDHYENFPVAPFFLPKQLRNPIALIYAFARRADDLADEGLASDEERLQALENLRAQLPGGQATNITPFFQSLNAMIDQQNLPVQYFHDLLDAFSLDVSKKTYETFDEILAYCRQSANPVGRLILHLTHEACEQNLDDSDAICTALQLINFLQDWYQDWTERKRIYIPQSDLRRFEVSFEQLNPSLYSDQLKALLDEQWQRCYTHLIKGFDLGNRLAGRIGFDIRLTIQGGWHMLKRLENRPCLFERPTLTKRDWLSMMMHAGFKTKKPHTSLQLNVATQEKSSSL